MQETNGEKCRRPTNSFECFCGFPAVFELLPCCFPCPSVFRVLSFAAHSHLLRSKHDAPDLWLAPEVEQKSDADSGHAQVVQDLVAVRVDKLLDALDLDEHASFDKQIGSVYADGLIVVRGNELHFALHKQRKLGQFHWKRALIQHLGKPIAESRVNRVERPKDLVGDISVGEVERLDCGHRVGQ